MSDYVHATFERELEHQAKQFSLRQGGANKAAVRTYIVADFEFNYDRSRYQGYRVAEGTSAESKIRWPFHRIAAASWQIMICSPGLDTPTFEAPVVMTNEHHTETEIIEAFFAAVTARPTATVTTWGGEVRDFAVLRRKAEENFLLLPRQIADLSPLSFHRIDLCDASAVRSERVHLSEYAAACSVLAKPSPSKAIGKLVENGDWGKVREQVLADVVTTTVILIMHLNARSVISCDRAGAIMKLADTVTTTLPHNRFATRTFRPWAEARLALATVDGKTNLGRKLIN